MFCQVGVVLITKPPFIVKLFLPSNHNGHGSKDIDWVGYGFTFLGTLLTGSWFVKKYQIRKIEHRYLKSSCCSPLLCNMAFGTMVFQNIESNSTDSADSLYHNMSFLTFQIHDSINFHICEEAKKSSLFSDHICLLHHINGCQQYHLICWWV